MNHRPLPSLLVAGALLALPLAWSPAHAQLFADNDARKAILDLRGTVQLLQQETRDRLDSLERRADDLTTRVERVESGTRGQLELQSQLQQMQEEIARLRGRLEELEHRLAGTAGAPGGPIDESGTRIGKFEPVVVEIDGRPVTVDQKEKQAFDSALQTFRSGDYRAAAKALEEFRAQYPDSPYQPGALFWLGSSQFALKDYPAAIASQQLLLKNYPDNPRAPDALFNIGYAQAESGAPRDARKTLDEVVARYPDSQAAQRARERLASLPR